MIREYPGQSFKEFLAAEEEAARPVREAQGREQAARQQRGQAARAKRVQLESAAKQAEIAQAFKTFWANFPTDTFQYHRNYAFAKGHIRDREFYGYEPYEGFGEAMKRANAELNDPAQHAVYCPDGTSWRQRQQIIDEATKNQAKS